MHKRMIVAVLTAAGLGTGCVSSAYAGFVNETQPAVAAPASAASAPAPAIAVQPLVDDLPVSTGRKVTQIGYRPSDDYVPRGKGRDIALADMLPVIAPKDFRIEMGDVDRSQRVSWSGGLPWDTVLTNAIGPLAEVHATIDWSQRVVSLHHGGPSPALAATVVNRSAATSGTGGASAGQVAALAPFELVGGQSLEIQLMAWAKRAGWAVSWNTPDDFVPPHDSSWGTDFQSAVTNVFEQLAANGADVHADIWKGKGDNTVVVDKPGAGQ